MDHTEEQLMAMNNPFALIVLAAQKALLLGKIPEEELGEQRLTIGRAMIQTKKYDSEQIKRFLYFLKNFVHISNLEINIKFDRQIALLTGNERAMGIIETIKMLAKEEAREEGLEMGRKIGRDEEKRIFVKNLIVDTNFSTSKIATLTGVSEDFVSVVRKELNL